MYYILLFIKEYTSTEMQNLKGRILSLEDTLVNQQHVYNTLREVVFVQQRQPCEQSEAQEREMQRLQETIQQTSSVANVCFVIVFDDCKTFATQYNNR